MSSKDTKKNNCEFNSESKKEFIVQKISNYFNPQFIDINNQKVTKKFPWLKIFGWVAFVIIIVLMITTIKPDFQNWNEFWKQIGFFFRTNQIAEVGASEFTPLETFIRGLEFLWTTISYSILGTIFGILISVPLALLSSKNFIKNKFIYIPFRILMSIVRAVPPVVFAFIFFFLFTPSLAAMFSIMVFVSSLMTKWLYEDLDTYDMNSYQGTIAIGNTKALAFKSSVLPYLMKRIVSYGFYSFEMVIRFAAILSIVGIGTIGQLLSDQYATENNFSHMSIVLWTLVIAMIVIESLNFLIKKYILEYTHKHPKIDDSLPYEKQLEQLKSQKSKMYIFKIFIIILIVSLLVASLTQIEWGIGNEIKISQFKEGIGKLFNPDWSLFQINDWAGTKTSVIPLGVEAFLVAIASSIIGLFFALIFGILASKNITKWFAYPFKLMIIVIRAIPAFTFAALFLILSKDSKLFVGVLSLGIHSIGMLGKLVMESVEKIPKKTFDALNAAGATWFQKIKFVVFKSIMPQALSNFLYRVEINFKSTVVIGAVGASDFGFQISTYSSQTSNWDKLASYLIFTIVILLILEQISDLVRSKLMTGYFFNQDVWFKRLMNKRKLTRSLALSIINNEIFRSDIRYANYMLAKHQFDKLFVYKYNLINNKLPDKQTLIQLRKEYKNYLKAYSNEIIRISKETKQLYKEVYSQTMNNQKTLKNWFKKNQIAKKSANIAIDKYFESYAKKGSYLWT
ncbi:PhnE/PtxC family ABC transporter permease [Metamycoplasma auris]|uniref:ABC-type phosphate/phosphonate transport system permease subunit n=1 Tax=Metamycoplasma auris TaxID=51363 RepID=A0A2W7G2F8_9BACT|nr:ABC transporter permease subunit [Metamycoplasma auris]PZV99250.1 ABC-type phosphate/phosphonate transport system permease subunit [Metamycoplasma auris]